MSDTITITGLVATTPRHVTTAEGLHITSFRLASTQRRFDRSQEKWIDGDTNWYTITTFRQLALNAVTSINKGQRVVATGRLRIREWENGEKSGTTIDIEADALGHDLSWGSAVFTRSVVSTPSTAAEGEGTDAAAPPEATAQALGSDGPVADTWASPLADSEQPALATPF